MEQYANEAAIWKTEGQIANSGGNFCLHLLGNLNNYIGKELGNIGFVRNRELEFTAKQVPRQELIIGVENTIRVINQTFARLDDDIPEYEYPVVVFEHKMSTAWFLVHLSTHLAYHLGQFNYHRRLIEAG